MIALIRCLVAAIVLLATTACDRAATPPEASTSDPAAPDRVVPGAAPDDDITPPIVFEDVSAAAGMAVNQPTAGSAWGDLDGDGWPDLWVSNHHGRRPSLYRNQKDGTFADLVPGSELEPPDGAETPDFHGSAWGDFDADGDEDLLVLTGGGAGQGASASHLFRNDGGTLAAEVGARGLDYPLGRGRTPLWIDLDGDRQLDVLFMNKARPEAPSRLFRQQADTFIPVALPLEPGAADGQATSKSLLTRLTDRLAAAFSEPKTGSEAISVDDAFAQLADFDGDRQIEVVAYGPRTQVLGIASGGLVPQQQVIAVPAGGLSAVQDAVIADLDGDGTLDWFLLRARPGAANVALDGTGALRGRMTARPGAPATVSFVAEGALRIELHRPWVDPSDPRHDRLPVIGIGDMRLLLDGSPITIDPDGAVDPTQSAARTTDAADEPVAVTVSRDANGDRWKITSTLPSLGFIIASTDPIADVATSGFRPGDGALDDQLLFNRGGRFESGATVLPPGPTACFSAVGADFDNDMDIDLYLACNAPTGNIPGRLYLNDGAGRFTGIDTFVVSRAGSPAEWPDGRANQVTTADFDRDGFVDLFITNGAGAAPFANGPHQLLRNAGNGNHWVEIDLAGTTANPRGIGAIVEVLAGGREQLRIQDGGQHSFSQNHARLHFGLGRNNVIEEVRVYWPDGRLQTLHDQPADQLLVIRQPEGEM